MAKLNVDAFSEEYRDVVPKECACVLVECLSDKERTKLKEDWNKIGGHNVITWWKCGLENIEVKYQN